MQNISARSNILFVTHPHHRFTQSFDWLYETLGETPKILYGNTDTISQWLPSLKKNQFKLIIIFQLEHLALYCSYFSPVLVFPMYDHTRLTPDTYLRLLKDVEWVSFSRTLHHRLSGLGLSSMYLQYACDSKLYPKATWKSGPKAYFWERVPDEFDQNAVKEILTNMGIRSLTVREVRDKGFSCNHKKLKVKKSLTWGDRRDYLKSLAKKNIFIAPRRFEGLGMTIIEAMAMGMCVIAEDAPTANEYILSGYNGILYRGGNEMIYPPKVMSGKQLAEMGLNARATITRIHEQWTHDSVKIGALVRKLLVSPCKKEKPPSRLLDATVSFHENQDAFWKTCETLSTESMIWRSKVIQTRCHSRQNLLGRCKWLLSNPRACLLDVLGKNKL